MEDLSRAPKTKLTLPQVALLVALPLLLFGAVVVFLYGSLQARATERGLEHVAAVTRLSVERFLAAELRALATLAASPALDGPDLDLRGFRAHAMRALGENPQWVTLVLCDRRHRLFDARHHAAAEPLPILDGKSVERAFATGAAEVSGIVVDPEWSDEPVVTVRVPVVRDGAVRFTITAVTQAWALGQILRDHAPSPDWRVAVMDAGGRLVARSASADPADPALGRPPHPLTREALARSPEGHFAAKTVDGLRIDGYALRLPTAGWTILTGVPGTAALGPVRWPMVAVALGGVAAAAIALALAMVLGRALARRDAAEVRLRAMALERAVEERLGEISANLPGLLYRRVRHPDGRVEYPYVSPNESFARRLGAASPARDDVLAAFRRALTPASRRMLEQFDGPAAGPRPPIDLEFELELAEGPLWLRTLARPREDGEGRLAWDGVILDVTAQKAAEADLRASEERLRLALEASGLGMFDRTEPAHSITWSDRLREIFGVPDGVPVTADTYWSALHPEDAAAVQATMRKALDPAGTGGFRAVYRFVRADGAVRWLSSHGQVRFAGTDGHRSPVRVIGVAADITEAMEATRALEAARASAELADQEKSRFLAAASHDLRQPVQALSLLLPALAPHVRGSKGADVLATARAAAAALCDLLDTLMDVSRLDAGVVEPRIEDVPLAPLLEGLSILRPAAADKGLDLVVEPTALAARSDATLLARMLRNLVENAIKYTEAGRVAVSARAEGGGIRLEVSDTGIGIAREHLDMIWREFEQVGNPERDRSRGLGLGLSIVRRLSLLLGHRIEVRSAPGAGSTFAVTLPLAEAPPAAAAGARAEPPEVPPPAPAGALVALIEDDVLVRAGLELTLRDGGYEVIAAGSGAQALEALRPAPRAPDALLADFRLGGGETGVDAIRAVRAAFGFRIPAMVLTGETGEEALAAIAAAGLSTLAKPITSDALLAAVAAAVRRRVPESA